VNGRRPGTALRLLSGAGAVLGCVACTRGPVRVSTSPTPTVRSSAPANGSPSSSPTEAPSDAPAVTAAGTRFHTPARAVTKAYAADPQSCELLDAGWHGRCGRFRSGAREAAYVLQERDQGHGRFAEQVHVYRREASRWRLVLVGEQALSGGEGGDTFGTVSDLAKDGAPKLVLITTTVAAPGLPNDRLRQIDVVEASGVVVVHRDLRYGVARRADGIHGGLRTWSAATTNPYGNYTETTIRYQDGAWRIVGQRAVQPRDVPPQRTASDDPDAL
jgi:hypothetical protein